MPRVSGTRDIFGEEIRKINFLESKAREFFSKLGFEEIRTPILEYSEIFQKSLGEGSEIIMHQMYVFEDKDGKEVALRPEGTAPSVRFYIENLMNKKPRAKLLYIGPMFRRERPQRGRFRQFHQIGCEMFGFDSPESDFYLISVLSFFLKEVGVEHKIDINSVGCPICRPKYSQKLKEFFSNKPICTDCQVRLKINPLRILDCKKDIQIVKEAPDIREFLCEKCSSSLKNVVDNLKKYNIKFEENPKIVRGLEYYTGVVFEVFFPEDNLAIAAGGRYDLLVESMGGNPTPALGFAIGTERLANILMKKIKEEEKRDGVFICYTQEGKEKAFEFFTKIISDLKKFENIQKEGNEKILYELINEIKSGRIDISVEGQKSLKSQIRYADSQNFKFIIIFGKEEVMNNSFSLKKLESSEQIMISIKEFIKS